MAYAQPEWSESVQRMILASALFGDLSRRSSALLGEIKPELFGALGSDKATTPRARLAGIMNRFFEKYRTMPSQSVMTELVTREAATFTPAEETILIREWGWVADTEVSNEDWIIDEVRLWVEWRNLQNALSQAAGAIEQGPENLDAAKEILGKGMESLVGGNDVCLSLRGDADSRIDLWASGEEAGQKIPTGLLALDAALRGGPTRREAFYFVAPPKGLKTTFLLKVATNAMRRRLGVYFETFEMQALRALLRSDRMLSRSSKEEIRDDLNRLTRVFDGLVIQGAGELFVRERMPQQSHSVEGTVRNVERLRREGKQIDVVIVDYLNIMGSSRIEKEKRHELARISRDIAWAGKELDVLMWSAALVNRKAVRKAIIRKDDIAEVFEVVAVADGMIAIGASDLMMRNNLRRAWVMAAREEADETLAGDYVVDRERMTVDPADSSQVDILLATEQVQQRRRGENGNQGDG